MKKFITLLMVLVMLVAIVGCSGPGTGTPEPTETPTEAPPAEAPGPEEEEPADDEPKKDITIVVIPQQLGNIVFLPAKEGMEDAGKDLGINVEWHAPVRADATLQVEIIEGLIERKVDGIAISCAHPDALKDTLARAIEAGIAVSTFDADSPDSGRIFYCGTENYEAGVLCGQHMVELFKDSTKDKIRVAQLEGIPGAFDITARMEGFADAIAGTNIEVVYTGPCDDDVDKAVVVVEDYTRANGDNIDAWFMAGGWPYVVGPDALPELRKWREADPENRKVVTMDVFPSSKAHFDLNLIDVAVGQSFYNMGYQSVENLYKHIIGEPIDGVEKEGFPGLFIATEGEVVTPENYKEMIPDE
ncbi:MAG: substrate-binding domain-containing protein [Caldicoprobacterales bacterium]|jgi:ribose transport system substrate-binding protein|nr:sugar ABC transporter substrate-binding protein [Clostridiales bacterium]